MQTVSASAAGGELMALLVSGRGSLEPERAPGAPFPHLINYSVKLHVAQHKISNGDQIVAVTPPAQTPTFSILSVDRKILQADKF